jgi:heat shock protein HslJ
MWFSLASAATPLEECWQQSADRQENAACLRGKLAEAKDGLAQAYRAIRDEMERLDRVTGRRTAVKALDASQRAFEQYRERTCAWIAAAAAGGSGAGDMAQDCMIRLTRQRTAELEGQMPGRRPAASVPAQAVPAELAAVEWRLTALERDGKPIALPAGSGATLKLATDGRLSGRAPINGYFGAATLSQDGSLAWSGPMGSTQMAGPPELMEAEHSYFRILQEVTRWRTEQGELILENAEGSARVRFAR